MNQTFKNYHTVQKKQTFLSYLNLLKIKFLKQKKSKATIFSKNFCNIKQKTILQFIANLIGIFLFNNSCFIPNKTKSKKKRN